MIKANRLLQQVKKKSGQAMRTFSSPTEERLALIGWRDAALQNRIDGGSTKELLFTCSSEKALQGEGRSTHNCDQLGKPSRQGVPQRHLRGDTSYGGS